MSESLPRGTALPGQSVLEGIVGAGRVRTVYAARTADGRRAAAHVLHTSVLDELSEWFENTARDAADLDHPGLVKIFATGKVDGRIPVVVTEFLEGETLRELLAGPSIPAAEIARVMVALGAVLDYLHGRTPAILHRALMPENVFLADPDHRVKLLEVGTADRPRFPATRPAYHSPEELAGLSDLSPRADVFVLASLAYELLTGSPAFPGDAATALGAIRADARPSAVARRRGIGPGVDAVLKRAWSLNPEGRPATAGAFARELSEALASASESQPDSAAEALAHRRQPDDEPTSKLIALDATGIPVVRRIGQPMLTPLAPRQVPRDREPRLPAAVVASSPRAPSGRPAPGLPPTLPATAKSPVSSQPPAVLSPVEEATDRDIHAVLAPSAVTPESVLADPPTPRLPERPALPLPPSPVELPDDPTPAPVAVRAEPLEAPVLVQREVRPPALPRPVPQVLPDATGPHHVLKDDPTEIFNIPVPPPKKMERPTNTNLAPAWILANGIALAGIAHAIAWAIQMRTPPVVIQAPAPMCAPCAACPASAVVVAPPPPQAVALPAPEPAADDVAPPPSVPVRTVAPPHPVATPVRAVATQPRSAPAPAIIRRIPSFAPVRPAAPH